MLKVANRKAVSRLARKTFLANQSRNLIAALAIALTAVLFTALFTMSAGLAETFQRQTIRQAGGDGHAMLKYVDERVYEDVKDHPLIEKIAFNLALCDGVENPEFLKRHCEFWYMDAAGLELAGIKLAAGSLPLAADEVIADTETLALLGVPSSPGEELTLELDLRGQVEQRTFRLSGYWDSDPVFPVGQVISSRAYVEERRAELSRDRLGDPYMTGAASLYLMFKNTWDLEGKLQRVLEDSGYVWVEDRVEGPNEVFANTNWAYMSENFTGDPGTVLAIAGALALIILTGYLIIYNIFQISVIKDIRFYGLLKTIGATGRQIKRVIRRQALALSLLGIPAGLLIGFFLGKFLIPAAISITSYDAASVTVTANPLIFAGAALFALFTVWISTNRPGRLAASVSPVEAVRLTEGGASGNAGAGSAAGRAGGLGRARGSARVSARGAAQSGARETAPEFVRGAARPKPGAAGRLWRMALANLGRDKRRAGLVILSLSLSLTLLNCAVTFAAGFDLDKYLSRFVDTDFLTAHVNYFNYNYFGEEPEDTVSEAMIAAIEGQPEFLEGGRIFYTRGAETLRVSDPANSQKINQDQWGNYFGALYGMEELPLSRLKLLAGEYDEEKLRGGDYILYGVHLDDNGQPRKEDQRFQPGDKVTLSVYRYTGQGEEQEYVSREVEVLGLVAADYYTKTSRSYNEYSFYLPAGAYKEFYVTRPAAMTYCFNAKPGGLESMERFMAEYTAGAEPMMSYESKLSYTSEYKSLVNLALLAGGLLSLVVGFIGFLNFINSMLTSMVTRRRELAMLESVGMTRRQLTAMLCLEGEGYVLGTAFLSLILGTAVSLLIIRGVFGQFFFFRYHLILWPILAALPVLALLGLLVPLAATRLNLKKSVVERLSFME